MKQRKHKHRKQTHCRLATALPFFSTVAALLCVAAYLVIPASRQWNRAEAHATRGDIVQDLVAPGRIDRRLIQALRTAPTSTQAAPIIITYHDIGRNKSPYTVAPEDFASQMQMLHDAGWTTLSMADLGHWLDGEALPPKSVLVTFDDGAKGVWRYADPVFQRLGMRGVAFLITGFLDTSQPYYMTWDEVQDLANSGRWDLEAHTHLGHVKVPVDAAGTMKPFLTDPMWLKDQSRVETMPEWHARVYADLVECKHQFELHDLPVPDYFAYPFSAHEAKDDNTAALDKMVNSLYRMAMLDDSTSLRVTSSRDVLARLIRRGDVTAGLGIDGLASRILDASPLDPSQAQPLNDPNGWVNNEGDPATIDLPSPNTAVFNSSAGQEIDRDYRPVQSSMWTNYTVDVDVAGFRPGDGSMAGVTVLKPSQHVAGQDAPHQIEISLHSNQYSINDRQNDSLSGIPLEFAPTHHVHIEVTPPLATITIDGAPPVTWPGAKEAPRGVGGGISIWGYRDAADSSPLVFSNMVIR